MYSVGFRALGFSNSWIFWVYHQAWMALRALAAFSCGGLEVLQFRLGQFALG